MIPGRRLCKASELKGTYVYLASDASSYMTGKHKAHHWFDAIQNPKLTLLLGADLIVDGGYTLP
jgi:sorbose reductase